MLRSSAILAELLQIIINFGRIQPVAAKLDTVGHEDRNIFAVASLELRMVIYVDDLERNVCGARQLLELGDQPIA